MFVPGQSHATSQKIEEDSLTEVIATNNQAITSLLKRQDEEGYWVYELEADTTIPAEYVLLKYILKDRNTDQETKISNYIRSRQLPNGSWSLYENGPGNISATVKAYLSLKLIGVDFNESHMVSARDWILQHGGAESSNVFTRITLALFGQLPWHTVPAMPAEIISLPSWWFFSLDKVSYWSRCVIVPLLIVLAYKPVYRLPANKDVRELFVDEPLNIKHIDKISSDNIIKSLFFALDRVIKVIQEYIPEKIRSASLEKCEAWTRDHMKGEGGNGAIFPAMANAVVALKLRECKDDDPDLLRGIQSIEDLVVTKTDSTYVQPCVSPVWDTCLTVSALAEAGVNSDHDSITRSIKWLFDKQIFVKGDWARRAPGLASGIWAFQFENDFYPDVDDTAMVIMCMLRHDIHHDPEKLALLKQAENWIIGMQNSDGGWGAFDINNHYEYLNNIPFADHGALVDPSTADLTARCIEMFTMMGYKRDFPSIAKGLDFLKKDQRDFGGWYGRWGVNYIYGTWSVLAALGCMSEDPHQAYIQKAISWLKDIQNDDGGWGEDCNTYDDPSLAGKGASTPSQTAWAILGLTAVGEERSDAVTVGVKYLIDNYSQKHGWQETLYTGTGFPRVFYLRYHGYSQYFPIWALGQYYARLNGLPTRQQASFDQSIKPADNEILPN
ncbi:MAG: squalene--hopene cyclase [Gammaproteobacteria bacterium]|nr:squalene--hopene cyclase [Gammaproteobacteria bacterium]